jgi:hypothetical protein
MTTKLHSLTEITVDKLSACDLRQEATPPGELAPQSDWTNGMRAYRALAAKPDGTPEAQALDVLHIPATGRIGIAWGSDATWADIHSDETVDALVEMYLGDSESFEARA